MKELFTIGQAVTPIIKQGWIEIAGKSPKPKFGEIYHVRAYDHKMLIAFISLDEFNANNFYDQRLFSPVIGDAELEDALKEVDELVKV